MAHELGHALGRDHSPCGIGRDYDRSFPYLGGLIGTWGFDGVALRDPDVFGDVMGYCEPVWISDYTFDRLFLRIAYVNGLALPGSLELGGARASAGTKVRTLAVRPDGTLRWGSEKPVRGSLEGSPTRVELLDSRGLVIGSVMAPFSRFDHLPGGFIGLAASALSTPGLASVRVGTKTLARPR
jgi:hypothetical protein